MTQFAPSPYGFKSHFIKDATAALVLVVLLLPQSLAYAMLAGLPPQAGIYASLLPLLLYAALGSSSTLSIGPMALVSLMTATATAKVASAGTLSYWQAAMFLSLLSGVMLLLMGWLRMGFMANFLSHPVTTGFIGASGVLIGLSQCKHLVGVQTGGDNAWQMLRGLWQAWQHGNASTLLVGMVALGVLVLSKTVAKRTAGHRLGAVFKWLYRLAPIVVVVAGIVFVRFSHWYEADATWHAMGQGVSILKSVPNALPRFHMPVLQWQWLQDLFIPALLISLVSFGQSISMAQSLAARQRQRVRPNKELIALGACSVGSALSGGFPVTASLSRSVIAYESGATTRFHGVLVVVFMVAASLFFLPWLYYLPHAVLAAIVVALVVSLIDIPAMLKPWRYSPNDALAALLTFVITLLTGIETGLLVGVVASLLLHVYRSSTPHIAVVGLVPGTQHFRNIERHEVECCDGVMGIRLDESLYFANAHFLEDFVNKQMARQSNLRHVVMMCSGINDIDASGIEVLAKIENQLEDADIQLHLSEVKGPIMDKLDKAGFFNGFSGQVYLTQYAAVQDLDG